MTVIEINLDFKDSCLELIKLYFYNLQVFTKCVYMYACTYKDNCDSGCIIK